MTLTVLASVSVAVWRHKMTSNGTTWHNGRGAGVAEWHVMARLGRAKVWLREKVAVWRHHVTGDGTKWHDEPESALPAVSHPVS